MKKIIFSILILITLIAVGADKKITDLTLLSSGSFATGDTIPIVDVSANATKKTTIGELDNRYSFNSLAPSQSGNSGKFITTNGSSASWSLVSLTTNVSGTLPIANGGTGQTSSNDALNALLPSQTSNSGKYLTTDGTNTSWGTVASGITALTSDVTASGTGSVAATVASVGGKSAAQVSTSVDDTLAAASANTASVIVKRDSSKNFLVNNVGTTTTSTTTSNNATLTLTVASSKRQRLGGTGTNYKVKLPDATTLGQTGFSFYIDNRSSQDISVIDNGSNVLYTVPTLSAASVIASSIGSSNGTWEIETAIGQPATDSASGYFSAGDHATFTSTNSTVSARTSANTASAIAARSSDGNIWTNGAFQKMTTTATAAGTTTLTVASSPIQIWTGTTTQTIKMPAANTLVQVGTTYKFINQSTGTLTIQDNSAGAITTVLSGAAADIIVTNIGSAAGTWISNQPTVAGSAPAWNYTSQTTTYSASINDWVVASGSAFTITLPTAVGNSGKSVVVEHAGSNFVKYKIHTTSSQTIRHAGTTYTNTDINTNDLIFGITKGEQWTFQSDGSNWSVTSHLTKTPISSSSTITFGATTTPPVKGTTTTDSVRWARDGQFCIAYYEYLQSGTGTNAVGDIKVTLPSSISLDTTLVTVNTTVSTVTMNSNGMISSNFVGQYGGAGRWDGVVAIPYDSTTFRLAGYFGGVSTAANASSWQFASSSTSMSGWVKFPVSGWLP